MPGQRVTATVTIRYEYHARCVYSIPFDGHGVWEKRLVTQKRQMLPPSTRRKIWGTASQPDLSLWED